MMRFCCCDSKFPASFTVETDNRCFVALYLVFDRYYEWQQKLLYMTVTGAAVAILNSWQEQLLSKFVTILAYWTFVRNSFLVETFKHKSNSLLTLIKQLLTALKTWIKILKQSSDAGLLYMQQNLKKYSILTQKTWGRKTVDKILI